MGMSDDLEAAIAEGATLVRVGTALFGPRREARSQHRAASDDWRRARRACKGEDLNITFIGGGNMARALIGGLIARGHASNALSVVEISPDARATVAARFGVATFAAIEAGGGHPRRP